jgi:hypothetical protein
MYGGDDFSHAYRINYQYFGLQVVEMKRMPK